MSNSKIRWSSIQEPETPPSARVYMWYDLTDQIFKIKRDDGIPQPLTSTCAANFEVEYITLNAAQIIASEVTLSHIPTLPAKVCFDVIGGGAQFYGDDFTVSSNILSWDSKPLHGVLAIGDKVRISYMR